MTGDLPVSIPIMLVLLHWLGVWRCVYIGNDRAVAEFGKTKLILILG